MLEQFGAIALGICQITQVASPKVVLIKCNTGIGPTHYLAEHPENLKKAKKIAIQHLQEDLARRPTMSVNELLALRHKRPEP